MGQCQTSTTVLTVDSLHTDQSGPLKMITQYNELTERRSYRFKELLKTEKFIVRYASKENSEHNDQEHIINAQSQVSTVAHEVKQKIVIEEQFPDPEDHSYSIMTPIKQVQFQLEDLLPVEQDTSQNKSTKRVSFAKGTVFHKGSILKKSQRLNAQE